MLCDAICFELRAVNKGYQYFLVYGFSLFECFVDSCDENFTKP